MEEAKFKVGDKVRIKAIALGFNPYKNEYGSIGSLGVITHIDNSEMPFCVDFGNNNNSLWYEDNGSLELVKEEPKVQEYYSKDKERWEWLKQYFVSGLTIDSFEDEFIDCKTSTDMDTVVDNYSSLVSFKNKQP